MKVSLKLKNANIDKLCKNLIILVDTREQKNKHITDFFDKNKIQWKIQKLDYGDYSCMLKKDLDLGLPFDISLENIIAIEKKNSLNEIAGNIGGGRTAFENEFIRSKKCQNFILLIENGSWTDIRVGNYNSELGNKAFYNTLLSWRLKYNFQIDFVDNRFTGSHIYEIFKKKLEQILEE